MRGTRRSSETRTRRPLVLLAEDSADLRELFGEILTNEGFSVIEAGDGREAVARARSGLPDIIVMDLSLPVLDGAAATRVLKTYLPTARIPILALTGLRVSVAEAQAMGLEGVIRKPCDPEALVAHIRQILRPSGRRTRS